MVVSVVSISPFAPFPPQKGPLFFLFSSIRVWPLGRALLRARTFGSLIALAMGMLRGGICLFRTSWGKTETDCFLSFASFGASPLFFSSWSRAFPCAGPCAEALAPFYPLFDNALTRALKIHPHGVVRPLFVSSERTMTLGGPLAGSPFHLLA